MQYSQPKIILASASPRRSALLKQIGINHEILPADLDESLIQAETPSLLAQKLSLAKATAIYEQMHGAPSYIIGADTLVTKDSRIFGKPNSKEEALQTLSILQGNEHTVYTGVTIIYAAGGRKKIISFVDGAKVWMYPLTPGQIELYIKTGEPFDKAGGYGIHDKGALLIREIQGDYYTVVGLPLAKVYRELVNLGYNAHTPPE